MGKEIIVAFLLLCLDRREMAPHRELQEVDNVRYVEFRELHFEEPQ